MKIPALRSLTLPALTAAAIAFAAATHAQNTNATNYGTITFDTSADVTTPPWQNWFGGAFQSVAWSTNDEPDSALTTNTAPGSSGSLQITSTWNGTGDQIMVMNNFGGYNPALNGAKITNFECDVMFDPSSCSNPAGNFGGLHFGSRGTGFGQPMFGTLRIPTSQAGQWVHVSFPVSSTLQPAYTSMPNVLIQLESFGNPMTGTSIFYVDNITFDGVINLPPPPPPTMSIVTASPGLRIFAKNADQTFNQEGIGTLDANQSWVGVASVTNPVSYEVTIKDFDTVDNYTLNVQFVPTTVGVNPFVVFSQPNAMNWSIVHRASGFTSAVVWKTNAPSEGNLANNAMNLTTTSLNGRGTWKLTFTNNTDGTVVAPDGSSNSFSLPPDMAAMFANPLEVLFGTAPNATAGFGQFIDLSNITITNVLGLNENSDFTVGDTLDTTVWSTAFSLDANSVVQVSTDAPIWVRWTFPDTGFATGLENKASLTDTNIPWHSLSFWNGVTPFSSLMGAKLTWILVPTNCFPTVDGNPGSAPSSNAFFQLSNPPPAQ